MPNRSKLLPALLPAVLLVACATSPLGRTQLKLYPDSDLDQMGVTAFAQTSKDTPVTSNGQTTAYVNCVANAITREVGGVWEVKVFESKEVNAFALPGGKIGVYTGLLKVTQTQDQLAAVIGHEVAHVIAGHSNERVSQQQVAGLGMGVAQVILGGGPGGGAVMSALWVRAPGEGRKPAVVYCNGLDSNKELLYWTKLPEALARRGISIEAMTERAMSYAVAVPTWGVGTGGTRFARFPGPGEPRNIHDKLEDCGVINQLTRVTGCRPETSGPGCSAACQCER